MANKTAHLQMIQGVISRMAGHSFLVKGWSITLTTALIAVAANTARPALMLVALFPVLAFWGLDAWLLYQEWRFRSLYTTVCGRDEDKVDFSMEIEAEKGMADAFASKTLVPFHAGIVITAIGVTGVLYLWPGGSGAS